MKTIFITFLLASSIAFAQPALTPPQVGFLQDGANAFRPVYGVAGNFLLGNPAASGVVSAAFSGTFGIVSTGSALTVSGQLGQVIATMDAPAGPAAFAFSREGMPALAYFPSANLLLQWNSGAFQMVSFDSTAFPGSAVQSIALPDPEHAAFIVQRDEVLWDVRVLLATGEVDSQAALPGVNAPVLMLASRELVFSDANGIVILRRDGAEIHLAAQLPANFSLQQMGHGWLQGRDLASAAQFAVRVTAGHEGFFTLPEVQQ
jgi:hypothetical protein